MKKLKNKNMPKSYVLEIIKSYPQILSGRKNFLKYEKRLQKNITIIKKFIKHN